MKISVNQSGKKFYKQLHSITIPALAVLLCGFVAVACAALPEAKPSVPRSDHITVVSTPPDSLVNLTRQLSPTVVNIRVTRQNTAPTWQPQSSEEAPLGEWFRRFFEHGLPNPHNGPRQSAGSGVVISKEGYILTNHHVVDGAQKILITTSDHKTYDASLTGSDPKTDLAVLKIDPSEVLAVAELGDSEGLMVGEWVMAIGNPFGLGHTVTTGIVSAKGRVIGAGPYDDFIQTDASINPGNSGGPLFNMQGKLIGINTAIIPQGQGIGFAIPINTVKPLIPQLVKYGHVTRGFLGVSIQDLTSELIQALHLKHDKGALVADVVPDGPADKAGITAGDVIIAYAGKQIEKARHLPVLVANTPVGQRVTLTIIRNNQLHDINLTPGEFPTDQTRAEVNTSSDKTTWGLYLKNLPSVMKGEGNSGEVTGVVVTGIEPASPAQKAGIRRGDIIVEINRQAVTDVKRVDTVLAQAGQRDTLLIRLLRGDTKQYVALAR